MAKSRRSFLAHLGAVFALPFTATVVIPWLLLPNPLTNPLEPLPWGIVLSVAGLGFFIVGLFLIIAAIRLFIRVGQGTLAPWAPTQNLVEAGIYRNTRNPMITGVIGVLLAEACWVRTWAQVGWAVLFFAINHIYFIVSEEPGLEKRFGEAYRQYKAEVPRWLPKWKK